MTSSHDSLENFGVAPVRDDAGTDKWFNLIFGGLLIATVVSLFLWATGQIGVGNHVVLLITTIAFGCFMAFNIGGNDVANSFGTSVGAGTLTMKQALLIAAVFEVGGAVLAGGDVTDTVKSGIVKFEGVSLQPMDFAYIMLAALLGAALWLLVATKLGWPVSTTHSIVGGIVGAAVTLGFVSDATGDMSPWAIVQWGEIGNIVISWFLSPALGGLVAYALYFTVKKTILVYNDKANAKIEQIRQERTQLAEQQKIKLSRLSGDELIRVNDAMARDAVTTSNGTYAVSDLESDYFRQLHRINSQVKGVGTHRALIRYVPLLALFGSVVITSMMLFKGLKNIGLHLTTMGNLSIILMVAAVVWMAVYIFARTMVGKDLERSTFVLFSWMQVFTAATFAFSHGSNDIANAVGPFAAVLDVLKHDAIQAKAEVPMPLMITAGISLVVGLWFIGRHVIQTVGTGLTQMHPASGFSAELSAAGVVMGASLLGLPVSSTHILIGAILGVGMVNRSANWGLMRRIAMAWVITIPVSAVVGAVGFVVLRAVFGA